jgi:hypothetical protein
MPTVSRRNKTHGRTPRPQNKPKTKKPKKKASKQGQQRHSLATVNSILAIGAVALWVVVVFCASCTTKYIHVRDVCV